MLQIPQRKAAVTGITVNVRRIFFTVFYLLLDFQ